MSDLTPEEIATMRCEDCELLIVTQRSQCRCDALRPANVDFRWDKAEIPMGRFVSEFDYLRECPLWVGPVYAAELVRRAGLADAYIETLAVDLPRVNRFAVKSILEKERP